MASSRILKILKTLKTVGSLSVVGLATSFFCILLNKYQKCTTTLSSNYGGVCLL